MSSSGHYNNIMTLTAHDIIIIFHKAQKTTCACSNRALVLLFSLSSTAVISEALTVLGSKSLCGVAAALDGAVVTKLA